MDAIEKRARELLAAEYERYDDRIGAVKAREQMPAEGVTMRAIIAALTPPDGCVPERSVLVAATRLRKLASAATPIARSAYIKAAELIEMTVVAARPEGPDSTTVAVVSKGEAEELSRRRVAHLSTAGRDRRNNERYNHGDLPMIPKFPSLDEATHHLYLEGREGPIRCHVDGSVWDVWQDGRSRWVSNCEVA